MFHPWQNLCDMFGMVMSSRDPNLGMVTSNWEILIARPLNHLVIVFYFLIGIISLEVQTPLQKKRCSPKTTLEGTITYPTLGISENLKSPGI